MIPGTASISKRRDDDIDTIAMAAYNKIVGRKVASKSGAYR